MRDREEVGEGGIWRNLKGGGNADYGGMVLPSQQHVAPCVKEVEWGFDSNVKMSRAVERHN